MSKASKELRGKWLELYNQCLRSKSDFVYSKVEGFDKFYAEYLKSGLLVKQELNKNLSITEASNLADMAAKHAVTHARSSFKDRCSNEPIVAALRAASVMQVPGTKNITTNNGKAVMGAKFIYIVIAISTYTLSQSEIKSIITKFDSELIEYDSDEWTLTIKTFELHLESVEATAEELVELDKVTRATIPSIIAYLNDGQPFNADWKGFFNTVVERVKDKIKSVLNKIYTNKNEVDVQAIEDLFQTKPDSK